MLALGDRPPPTVDDLSDIDTWLFDLDNTLYPADSGLFHQVHRRMGEFIERRLGLTPTAARSLQRRLFEHHGTTLRGLMTEYDVPPNAFLDYVHDIDVSVLRPNPDLGAAIEGLPGRKLVFTNGSTGHATRVLGQLGITTDVFDAIEDIVASEFQPKPNPTVYERMVERHRIDPRRAIMVEDMAVNLAPAHAMGMTTVWVRTDHATAAPGTVDEHIHHVVDDVFTWLRDLSFQPA